MLTALLLIPALFASPDHRDDGRHEQAQDHRGEGHHTSASQRAQAARAHAARAHHARTAAAHRRHAHAVKVARAHHAHGPRFVRRPPPPVVRHAPPRGAVHSTTSRDATHDVSLTVSALHLAVPMAAVNAEFKLAPKSGLALTAGLGGYENAALIDVGAELRGYALGNFDRGLFVGASGRFTNVPYYTPTDPALAAAAVIGAKYTFDVPITIEGVVGPQIALSDRAAVVGPMVKLNVGFSF